MTQLPQVIGLTGKAGSGKTTAANWILRNHKKAMKLSFAQPLKKMVYELIRSSLPKGWPHTAQVYVDGAFKEDPIPFLANRSARELMQTLGTEWGRQTIQDDFWTLIAQGKLERLLGDERGASDTPIIRAVFDDVRFQNEAEMIRSYGGVIIRITRPQAVTDAAHASESEQDAIVADITLDNDGDEDAFIAKLAAQLPPPQKA